MNIRPATPDDCTALAALDAQSNPATWSQAQFLSALAQSCNHILLAEHADGSIQGFIVWQTLPDESELHLIATAPEYRRQGTASALLAHWFAATAPQTRLLLEVRQSNTAAQALYAKHGFSAAGIRKNYYRTADGTGEHAVIMEKTC